MVTGRKPSPTPHSVPSGARRPLRGAAPTAPAGSGCSGRRRDGRRPGRWRGNAGCIHHHRCSGDHDPSASSDHDHHGADHDDDSDHDHDGGHGRVGGGGIGGLLAVLGPPDFHPRDISKVEDRLEQVLKAWEEDKRDELIRELERAFEEVADLEESPERDELTAD